MSTANETPKNVCPECRGQGFWIKWKDPDEYEWCPECGGTGENRND